MLYCCGNFEKSKYDATFGRVKEHNYPTKGQCGFQQTNGPSAVYNSTRARMIEEEKPCEVCGRQYSDSLRFELHHKDGNRRHNEPENLHWCCPSCHKRLHYAMGRTRQMERGYPSFIDEIVSIDPLDAEDVYDVEMAAPYHNFVVDTGIVTSNSHAVCVALDSLYGAYLKAHYPLEYYTTLLSSYAEKGDKDRIAQAKDEMRKGFDIHIAPCRFRQDNRDFYIDRAGNTISDA